MIYNLNKYLLFEYLKKDDIWEEIIHFLFIIRFPFIIHLKTKCAFNYVNITFYVICLTLCWNQGYGIEVRYNHRE